MKKLSLIFCLTICSSILFAQETERAQKVKTRSNQTNEKVAIENENEPSETIKPGPGKSKGGTTQQGSRKGWDGTEKGVNVMIMPSAEGITVLFPDDIAFEVNETEKIIKGPGKSKGGANASGARGGLPVKGDKFTQIVKGGKKPGANTKIISSNAPNTYAIPEEWTEDGEYVLQIIYETADKSKLLSEFVLSKKGTNFQVAKGAGSPKSAGF